MQLYDIIKHINFLEIIGNDKIEISSIEYNSRDVKKNSLFVAIKGLHVDGHDYIQKAIDNGAIAIIIDNKCVFDELKKDIKVTLMLTESSVKSMALISNSFYEFPSESMKVIGITGTNGKTTTTYLLKSILETAGKKVGVIGTIGCWIGDNFIPSDKTTPESVKLFEMISTMKKESVEYLIMEVSSIALVLDRVYGLKYDVVVFTNLTQDHLDFHINFENYFKAKKLLFDDCAKPNGVAIYNIDDNYGEKIVKDFLGKKISYGFNNSSYFGTINSLTFDGLKLLIRENKIVELESELIGKFNAYNILASYAIAKSVDIEDDSIIEGIKRIKTIPGRFNKIKSDKGFWCIVDYSHTPDSLENAIVTIKQIMNSGSKLITVFGCGGDRDRSKRPIMGNIAKELSDVVVVTSDNPRTEEPMTIIEDILSGMNNRQTTLVNVDRKEAIKVAISLAEKEDVVLVAGKGHENYQEICNKKIHFDDLEIIKELLNRKN
jgi:UDP-N-acetylmuramoyl-L-alanyl-D-glutamate--2,6-diaminopimelate ligase